MIVDTTFHVGDIARRVQGRPADVGRTGVVVWLSEPFAGDILMMVRLGNGDEVTMYTRQAVKVVIDLSGPKDDGCCPTCGARAETPCYD